MPGYTTTFGAKKGAHKALRKGKTLTSAQWQELAATAKRTYAKGKQIHRVMNRKSNGRNANGSRNHTTSTSSNYGLAQDNCKVKMGIKKQLNKFWLEADNLQRIAYNYTNAIELKAASQTQQWAQGQLVWDPAMFVDAEKQLNTNSPVASPDLNLNNNLTAKMRIGTYEGISTILNQTNTPVTVTIYTCQFRQDAGTAVTAYNSGTPTTYSNQTVYLDILNGLNNNVPYNSSNNGTSIYTALTPTQPGVTPYQSSYFCTKYKVVHTKKVELNSGATFKHIFEDKRQQIINNARLNTSAIGAQGGLTYFRLYKIQGTVANAGTGTIPGIATAEVSILEQHTYHMAQAPLNQEFAMQQYALIGSTHVVTSNLGTATTVMSEMLDVSATVTEA